jgi:hypothetical protein
MDETRPIVRMELDLLEPLLAFPRDTLSTFAKEVLEVAAHFPAKEVCSRTIVHFPLPGNLGPGPVLRLVDGEREERGADRDDHVLLVIEPVGDGCGVDGRA